LGLPKDNWKATRPNVLLKLNVSTMKENIFYCYIFLASIFGLFSCNSSQGELDDETAHALLIDISGVREDSVERQRYAERAKDVVASLEQGDVLEVHVISDRSINEGGALATLQLPVFNASTDNPMRVTQEREHFDKLIKTKKDSVAEILVTHILTDERIAPRTQIIGAIHRAAIFFKGYPSHEKTLVILSDMEEFSDHYNFTKEPLDNTRIIKILESERIGASGLPGLKGINVSVQGARSSTQERFFEVRNFWIAFFKESGATFAEANYK